MRECVRLAGLSVADFLSAAARRLRARCQPSTVTYECVAKDPEDYLREWGLPQNLEGNSVTDTLSPGNSSSAHARTPSAVSRK